MRSNRLNPAFSRRLGCLLVILILAGTAGPLQAAVKEPALQEALRSAATPDELAVDPLRLV